MSSKKPYHEYFMPGEAEAFEEAWRSLPRAQRNFRSKDDARLGWMMASTMRARAESEDVRAAVQGEHVFTRYGVDPNAKEQPDSYNYPVGVYTKAVLQLDLRMVVPTDVSLAFLIEYVEEALDQWKGQAATGDPWRDIEILTLTPIDVRKS